MAHIVHLRSDSTELVAEFLLGLMLTCILQRYPVDRAYYIAKELLMTERTYKKDLEVITVVRFSSVFSSPEP